MSAAKYLSSSGAGLSILKMARNTSRRAGAERVDVRPNGIGEADRRIVRREVAGKNSYRSSNVKALAGPAAYLLALCDTSWTDSDVMIPDSDNVSREGF